MQLTVWHIITGLSLILNALLLTVIWFIKKWMNDIETRLRQIEDKQQEIEVEVGDVKTNYNDKFKSVELSIKRTENNVIREISDLKTHMAEVFVPQSFCKFIQDQKPKGGFG